MHRIPGLSRYFLYLNDDFMFNMKVSQDDFFDFENKTYKTFIDSRFYMTGSARVNVLRNKKVDISENSKCNYLKALGFSNMLLDDEYGSEIRYVPAHAPYPIDTQFLRAL